MPTIEAKPGGTVYVAPGSGLKDWNYGIDLARKWPPAEHIYDRVLKATGVNIFAVCERAQNEPIDQPEISQPAALGIGYASADFLRHNVASPDYLMGLSAGEFTVAAISGALSLEEAARLSHSRGAFQQKVAGGQGGSVMVLHHRGRGPAKRIKEAINGLPGAHISNFHTPFKTGIGYTNEAYANGLKKRLNLPGVRRIIDIPNVSFPPHGPNVEKAQEMLSHLVDTTSRFKDSTVPIVANKTGRLMQSGRTIKKNIIWQTTSPTQLNRGMAYLISKGVEDYIDIGPDNSMEKLLGDFVTLHNIRLLAANGL